MRRTDQDLHHRACSALALRLLAAGKIRAYEHACANAAAWLDARLTPQEALARSLEGCPGGADPRLMRGEAESANNLAAFYEHQYIHALALSAIWRVQRCVAR